MAKKEKQLYKIIGGDWGNSYCHTVKVLQKNDWAQVAIVGADAIIEVKFSELQPVPHIGA